MSKTPSTEIKTVPPTFDFQGEGLGTLRSSGAMIVMLLSMEEHYSRAGILVFAAKEMGISLEELTDEYLDHSCDKCGISMVLHKQTGGECP